MPFTIQLAAGVVTPSNTVDNYLTKDNQLHLQRVFTDAMKSDDLQAVYYASLNVEPTPGSKDRNTLCQRLPTLHKQAKSPHVSKITNHHKRDHLIHFLFLFNYFRFMKMIFI